MLVWGFFSLRAAPPIFHVCLSIALWSCKLVRQRFHGWIQPRVLCLCLKNSFWNISAPSLCQVSYLECWEKNSNFVSFCFALVETWKLLVLLEFINIINGLLLET